MNRRTITFALALMTMAAVTLSSADVSRAVERNPVRRVEHRRVDPRARESRGPMRSSTLTPSKRSRSATKDRGWTEPRSTRQRQALKEAHAGHGTPISLRGGIKDPRFQEPGWQKMGHKVAGEPHVQVHYMRNVLTGKKADFKFKLN